MNIIKWDTEFSVNIQEIDMQHQHIYDKADILFTALSDKFPKTEILKLIDDFIEYSKTHFSLEEHYFEVYNYSEKELHIRMHNEFKIKILQLKKEYENKPLEVTYKLINFIRNWIIDHIQYEDQKYKSMLTQSK